MEVDMPIFCIKIKDLEVVVIQCKYIIVYILQKYIQKSNNGIKIFLTTF